MNRPETPMYKPSCNSGTNNSDSAVDYVAQDKTNKTFENIFLDISPT